jgi:hypothetical protein
VHACKAPFEDDAEAEEAHARSAEQGVTKSWERREAKAARRSSTQNGNLAEIVNRSSVSTWPLANTDERR